MVTQFTAANMHHQALQSHYSHYNTPKVTLVTKVTLGVL